MFCNTIKLMLTDLIIKSVSLDTVNSFCIFNSLSAIDNIKKRHIFVLWFFHNSIRFKVNKVG